MSLHKRKYDSRKTVWFYQFALPGATRQQRKRIIETGFATKKEAGDAETTRRIEERNKSDLAKPGTLVAAELPKAFSMVLKEFFAQHVDVKLAPKTVERYHEQAAYLDPKLLNMPIGEITPLHLEREWNRLLKSGGHHRQTKEPRPLSAKTVRNVAGVISSAFAKAIKWGLLRANPGSGRETTVPNSRKGIGLSVAQKDKLIDAASGPWC